MLRKILLVLGLPTLLLSLLFCVLLWMISRDAGLGAGILIAYFYLPLMVIAGVVTAIVIFWFRVIPCHPGLILLALILWCVVPIFGGWRLAYGVEAELYRFYRSDSFIERRLDRLELSIEPLEQRYEYACGHTNFVATYRIVSGQETPLYFAIANADQEEWWFRDDATAALANASLSAKFRGIEGERNRPGPHHTLGLYVVPPGGYTVTVKGNVPFILAVYHPEPLWTPRLFLLDEWDFPEIYIDEYLTQAELASLPTTIQSPVCEAADLPAPAPPPAVEAPPPSPPTYFLDDRIYIPTITGQEDYLLSYTNHDVSFTPPREDGPGPLTVTYADDAKNTPIIDGAIYRTVTNTFTGQAVNIYVTVREKDDPQRDAQTPPVTYEEFVAALQNKPALTAADARYLQRTGGFFWADRGLQFEGFAVRFYDHITPCDHEGAVERLVEVIETMAPAAEFQRQDGVEVEE